MLNFIILTTLNTLVITTYKKEPILHSGFCFILGMFFVYMIQ